MTILLAQLGDIHIKTHNDPVLRLSNAIASAVNAEVNQSTEHIILAICGDITQSGQVSEFTHAASFLKSIYSTLFSQHPSISISFVIIPGNHDCDLSGDQTTRNHLLNAVKSPNTPTAQMQDILFAPLSNYFGFVHGLANAKCAIDAANKFHAYLDVDTKDGALRIHLLNTAWLSSIEEQPGALFYPLDQIETIVNDASRLGIAILHHPYNWFSQPLAMRQLADRVAAFSQIILFAHEHVPGANKKVSLIDTPKFPASVTVSGGVLQDWSNSSICTFNTICIHVKSKEVLVCQHSLVVDSLNPYFSREASKLTPLQNRDDIMVSNMYRGYPKTFRRYVTYILSC